MLVIRASDAVDVVILAKLTVLPNLSSNVNIVVLVLTLI
jgi:hypothetical protein